MPVAAATSIPCMQSRDSLNSMSGLLSTESGGQVPVARMDSNPAYQGGMDVDEAVSDGSDSDGLGQPPADDAYEDEYTYESSYTEMSSEPERDRQPVTSTPPKGQTRPHPLSSHSTPQERGGAPPVSTQPLPLRRDREVIESSEVSQDTGMIPDVVYDVSEQSEAMPVHRLSVLRRFVSTPPANPASTNTKGKARPRAKAKAGRDRVGELQSASIARERSAPWLVQPAVSSPHHSNMGTRHQPSRGTHQPRTPTARHSPSATSAAQVVSPTPSSVRAAEAAYRQRKAERLDELDEALTPLVDRLLSTPSCPSPQTHSLGRRSSVVREYSSHPAQRAPMVFDQRFCHGLDLSPDGTEATGLYAEEGACVFATRMLLDRPLRWCIRMTAIDNCQTVGFGVADALLDPTDMSSSAREKASLYVYSPTASTIQRVGSWLFSGLPFSINDEFVFTYYPQTRTLDVIHVTSEPYRNAVWLGHVGSGVPHPVRPFFSLAGCDVTLVSSAPVIQDIASGTIPSVFPFDPCRTVGRVVVTDRGYQACGGLTLGAPTFHSGVHKWVFRIGSLSTPVSSSSGSKGQERDFAFGVCVSRPHIQSEGDVVAWLLGQPDGGAKSGVRGERHPVQKPMREGDVWECVLDIGQEEFTAECLNRKGPVYCMQGIIAPVSPIFVLHRARVQLFPVDYQPQREEACIAM
ncbi:hypothetical protein KIPB_010142 [Kipferlia bialata]|uniref:Uncharacterized protein n=1 Tax=Kipferlia bialata TaxID=797122 RepID=A0A9K3GM51_9EUKA|nr:hypothetical protein KIPB_010142 [Kipferlia bialata]|eukprot:g10142.t1